MATSKKPKTARQTLLERLLAGAPSIIDAALGARMYLVKIGHEMAAAIIDECNFGNRRVKQHKVLGYKEKMCAGKWRLKNPIEFFDDGDLNDGQHRLRALRDSKGSQWFWVQLLKAKDRIAESAATDSGLVRSVGDFFQKAGIASAYRVAPVIVYERNFILSGEPLQHCKADKETYLDLYHDSLGEEVLKHAFDIVPRGLHLKCGMKSGFLDWFALHAARADPETAALFLQYVKEPTNLGATNPMYVLNGKLWNMKLRKQTHTISRRDQTNSIAKAWNLNYDQQEATLHKLKYTPGEAWPGIMGDPSHG